MDSVRRNTWVCISCGKVLGNVVGGEIYPANIPVNNVHTSGPNLIFTCDDCGATKVWYTSDPVVRAVYQLIDSVSSVAAKSMLSQLANFVNEKK
jgi:hypothetical protein